MDYSIRVALQHLVYRRKIKDTDHLKQVLNSCWDMISKEQSMLLLTSGLNDFCWSFILGVDTLSIVFVSSVMFACCKLFFCHDSIETPLIGTALAWRWGLWAPRILQILLFRNPKRRLLRVPQFGPQNPAYGGAKITGDTFRVCLRRAFWRYHYLRAFSGAETGAPEKK